MTRVAVLLSADFVALSMESYSLPTELVHRHAEFIEEYGSLAKCPHSIPVVSFSIETMDAIWVAQCSIKPVGRSKKRKSLVVPAVTDSFSVTEAAGLFVGLLPGLRIVDPTERDESRTLH